MAMILKKIKKLMLTRNSAFLTIFGDLYAIFTFFRWLKLAKKLHLAQMYAQVHFQSALVCIWCIYLE